MKNQRIIVLSMLMLFMLCTTVFAEVKEYTVSETENGITVETTFKRYTGIHELLHQLNLLVITLEPFTPIEKQTFMIHQKDVIIPQTCGSNPGPDFWIVIQPGSATDVTNTNNALFKSHISAGEIPAYIVYGEGTFGLDQKVTMSNTNYIPAGNYKSAIYSYKDGYSPICLSETKSFTIAPAVTTCPNSYCDPTHTFSVTNGYVEYQFCYTYGPAPVCAISAQYSEKLICNSGYIMQGNTCIAQSVPPTTPPPTCIPNNICGEWGSCVNLNTTQSCNDGCGKITTNTKLCCDSDIFKSCDDGSSILQFKCIDKQPVATNNICSTNNQSSIICNDYEKLENSTCVFSIDNTWNNYKWYIIIGSAILIFFIAMSNKKGGNK